MCIRDRPRAASNEAYTGRGTTNRTAPTRVAQNVGMTQISCPVQARVWRDGRVVASEVAGEEISDHIGDPSILVWVDLENPSPEDLAALADELGLAATAVEDALAPYERPKVTRHADHLLSLIHI